MKTTLYFGAPKPGQGCHEPSVPPRHFETAEQFETWMRNESTRRMSMRRHCLSAQIGMDGTRICSKEPHRHRVRLPVNQSVTGEELILVSCNNHIQAYLAGGWLEMNKLCTNCCTREATVQDTCDFCLDQLTTPAPIVPPEEMPTATVHGQVVGMSRKPVNASSPSKRDGYCVNQGQVLGCTIYAHEGSFYCVWCTNKGFNHHEKEEETLAMGKRRTLEERRKALNPRVRTIPSSARPCKLTHNCAGVMTAAVRRYSEVEKPELWWRCDVCTAGQRAERTMAVADPDAPSNAINVDMSEMAAHMRDIATAAD